MRSLQPKVAIPESLRVATCSFWDVFESAGSVGRQNHLQHVVCRKYAAVDQNVQFRDIAKLVGDAWKNLTPEEKLPYEEQAQSEATRYSEERQRHEQIAARAGRLRDDCEREGAP